ncbi:hypothetical protein SH601_17370 [Gracilibacillus sp. S3-1-1]|uniref:Uncharacterized protein n=1 Tax=Gracilibacillus pellucidus TaxID=3095368 RepID=A0ACC6MA05_9BACI|nr:hypothetical protein [Gracilibacillus sp. S3-1-1]MDX8047731.1 hypothetical protein [Gracilibacillus sp. S3-1-1]
MLRDKSRLLGGLTLFFKKMTDKEKKNAEKAVKVGFAFCLIALLISSIYSVFSYDRFNHSFLILIASLIVFFVSDFIFNKVDGVLHRDKK